MKVPQQFGGTLEASSLFGDQLQIFLDVAATKQRRLSIKRLQP
jgi:hypothetical protein